MENNVVYLIVRSDDGEIQNLGAYKKIESARAIVAQDVYDMTKDSIKGEYLVYLMDTEKDKGCGGYEGIWCNTKHDHYSINGDVSFNGGYFDWRIIEVDVSKVK